MAAPEDGTKPVAVRQRKAHRKSRLGCGNCKLRSVKCDESKPTCNRCASSGYVCNYARSAPALQLAGTAGASTLKLMLGPPRTPARVPAPSPSRGLPLPLPGLRIPVAGPVAGGDLGTYEMRPADYAAIQRFRTRTVLTVGSSSTRHLYREEAFALSSSDPFLMHVFLAFTLLHDSFLSSFTTSAAHRSQLAFHWYHGTALFHRNLSAASRSSPRALAGSHRDALWASAAILGSAAFAFVDSVDPTASWPLHEASPSDLDWLKMSDGKRAVWDIADPTRPDSIFHPLLADQAVNVAPNGLAPIPPDVLPASFYPLFDLASSTACTNPYHVATSILAQLLPREMNDKTVIQFLSFLSQLDPRFRRLLEDKDPRALLLLVYWLARLASFEAWWLNQRALIEGKAICIYLERDCADDALIMELVQYPKKLLFKIPGGGDVL
ncbi:hypothetical protein B0J13DRAFT_43792 [Dactylonectria estremocensis]|uniref:Zn(2)-C6 fungal-type domain-containing protein n=1 Tax=Dactylonectria estremocensis TaxID=1079267 RepID=A0A9P9ETX0_9HYPO|nr:hypothetical protein B0J13DRAFT_43792 [Dactylonectria estremocensis]